jgi:hypothetical protein
VRKQAKQNSQQQSLVTKSISDQNLQHIYLIWQWYQLGLEIREYGRRDLSRWLRDTLYPQTLALISPTSAGRSDGIVRLRTRAME